MNKEIQVLYTIFELELNPPFTVREDSGDPACPDIYDRFLNKIGYIRINYERIYLFDRFERSLLQRVKRVFNIDKLSYDDVYHINKHLYNWLQNKFPKKVVSVVLLNWDTMELVTYPD